MPNSVMDQAIDWHDLLRRDRSPETLHAFESWRDADPAHAREFEQQEGLIAAVASAGWRSSDVKAERSSPRIRWVPAGLALGAVGAAGLALLNWPLWNAGPGVDVQATDASPGALTRPVRFPDGTIAILAAGAEAASRFGADMRRVLLRGGPARFMVRGDAPRPLVVDAPGVRVIAREAVFDIDPAGDTSRVTVISGDVTVAPTDKEVGGSALSVGPQQSVDGSAHAIRPAPRDAARRVRHVDTDALPLGDLLRIAGATPGPRIVLADKALAARRIVGRFDISDHRALARKLAAALDLRLSEANGQLILSSP